MMFNFQIEKPKTALIDYQTTYDFIALGLGPAGMNGALYAKRKGLKTLLVGYDLGGQLNNTSDVDNYLGLGNIDASMMIQKFKDHITALEVPMLTEVKVTSIQKNDLFEIGLDNGETLRTKTLLYAFGGNPRKLGVPGEQLYASKGVSYCVTCDAPFFKKRHVIVAGGGNSALDAVIDLSRIASKVTIVHRSQFKGDQTTVDQIKALPNVNIHLETQILEIQGDITMTGVRIFDKKTQTESVIEADGIFIEIGHIPNSNLLEGLVELNDSKEIKVDRFQQTSIPGLYAAGDVTDNPNKQIIIAASEGAVAALSATSFINQKGDK